MSLVVAGQPTTSAPSQVASRDASMLNGANSLMNWVPAAATALERASYQEQQPEKVFVSSLVGCASSDDKSSSSSSGCCFDELARNASQLLPASNGQVSCPLVASSRVQMALAPPGDRENDDNLHSKLEQQQQQQREPRKQRVAYVETSLDDLSYSSSEASSQSAEEEEERRLIARLQLENQKRQLQLSKEQQQQQQIRQQQQHISAPSPRQSQQQLVATDDELQLDEEAPPQVPIRRSSRLATGQARHERQPQAPVQVSLDRQSREADEQQQQHKRPAQYQQLAAHHQQQQQQQQQRRLLVTSEWASEQQLRNQQQQLQLQHRQQYQATAAAKPPPPASHRPPPGASVESRLARPRAPPQPPPPQARTTQNKATKKIWAPSSSSVVSSRCDDLQQQQQQRDAPRGYVEAADDDDNLQRARATGAQVGDQQQQQRSLSLQRQPQSPVNGQLERERELEPELWQQRVAGDNDELDEQLSNEPASETTNKSQADTVIEQQQQQLYARPQKTTTTTGAGGETIKAAAAAELTNEQPEQQQQQQVSDVADGDKQQQRPDSKRRHHSLATTFIDRREIALAALADAPAAPSGAANDNLPPPLAANHHQQMDYLGRPGAAAAAPAARSAGWQAAEAGGRNLRSFSLALGGSGGGGSSTLQRPAASLLAAGSGAPARAEWAAVSRTLPQPARKAGGGGADVERAPGGRGSADVAEPALLLTKRNSAQQQPPKLASFGSRVQQQQQQQQPQPPPPPPHCIMGPTATTNAAAPADRWANTGEQTAPLATHGIEVGDTLAARDEKLLLNVVVADSSEQQQQQQPLGLINGDDQANGTRHHRQQLTLVDEQKSNQQHQQQMSSASGGELAGAAGATTRQQQPSANSSSNKEEWFKQMYKQMHRPTAERSLLDAVNSRQQQLTDTSQLIRIKLKSPRTDHRSSPSYMSEEEFEKRRSASPVVGKIGDYLPGQSSIVNQHERNLLLYHKLIEHINRVFSSVLQTERQAKSRSTTALQQMSSSLNRRPGDVAATAAGAAADDDYYYFDHDDDDDDEREDDDDDDDEEEDEADELRGELDEVAAAAANLINRQRCRHRRRRRGQRRRQQQQQQKRPQSSSLHPSCQKHRQVGQSKSGPQTPIASANFITTKVTNHQHEHEKRCVFNRLLRHQEEEEHGDDWRKPGASYASRSLDRDGNQLSAWHRGDHCNAPPMGDATNATDADDGEDIGQLAQINSSLDDLNQGTADDSRRQYVAVQHGHDIPLRGLRKPAPQPNIYKVGPAPPAPFESVPSTEWGSSSELLNQLARTKYQEHNQRLAAILNRNNNNNTAAATNSLGRVGRSSASVTDGQLQQRQQLDRGPVANTETHRDALGERAANTWASHKQRSSSLSRVAKYARDGGGQQLDDLYKDFDHVYKSLCDQTPETNNKSTQRGQVLSYANDYAIANYNCGREQQHQQQLALEQLALASSLDNVEVALSRLIGHHSPTLTTESPATTVVALAATAATPAAASDLAIIDQLEPTLASSPNLSIAASEQTNRADSRTTNQSFQLGPALVEEMTLSDLEEEICSTLMAAKEAKRSKQFATNQLLTERQAGQLAGGHRLRQPLPTNLDRGGVGGGAKYQQTPNYYNPLLPRR